MSSCVHRQIWFIIFDYVKHSYSCPAFCCCSCSICCLSCRILSLFSLFTCSILKNDGEELIVLSTIIQGWWLLVRVGRELVYQWTLRTFLLGLASVPLSSLPLLWPLSFLNSFLWQPCVLHSLLRVEPRAPFSSYTPQPVYAHFCPFLVKKWHTLVVVAKHAVSDTFLQLLQTVDDDVHLEALYVHDWFNFRTGATFPAKSTQK